jgi:hypothetical protein
MPCRAAKDLECVFPIWFTQCDRVWFKLAMLRPCHALTMPFFSRPRHSTAVERRPVGYLPALGFFRLPRGVPRRLLSEAYQSPSQRSIPTTVKSGSSILQKRRSVKLLDLQFGYFRLPRGLSRRTRHCRSRAGARYGMCELTARHGRGTAWARHGRGMGTACYVWIGLNSASAIIAVLFERFGQLSIRYIVITFCLVLLWSTQRFVWRVMCHGTGHQTILWNYAIVLGESAAVVFRVQASSVVMMYLRSRQLDDLVRVVYCLLSKGLTYRNPSTMGMFCQFRISDIRYFPLVSSFSNCSLDPKARTTFCCQDLGLANRCFFFSGKVSSFHSWRRTALCCSNSSLFFRWVCCYSNLLFVTNFGIDPKTCWHSCLVLN